MDWRTSLGGEIVTKYKKFLNKFFWLWMASSLSLFVALPVDIAACPGLIFAEALPLPNKYAIERNQLRLYSLQKNESGWFWRPISLQIDPYDISGQMLFPATDSWLNESLQPTDRLSFSVDDFSEHAYRGQYRLPCGARSGIQIFDQAAVQDRAYLVVCQAGTPQLEVSSPVSYQPEQREVTAERYRYRHDPKNHLMFREIAVKSGDDFFVVATNSDQLIRGDIRRFFTLNFDGHDIQAELFELRNGPLGIVGLLRFYLKILAFQIELSLTPEVQFFTDALFMPMSLHIPVEAKTYLKPGSGIYYTWQSPPEIAWNWEQNRITEHGKSDLESALSFCQGDFCRYAITGTREGIDFSLRFIIPRSLVELGFYPQLVRDSDPIKKQIKRQVSRFSDDGRMGFFFETSQLSKGNHDWDFWLHFGSSAQECPRRLRLRPLPRFEP